jgi:hypothetical protein
LAATASHFCVREVAGGSLRSTCSAWYIGANVPGKPRVFMPYIGGFPAYIGIRKNSGGRVAMHTRPE